MWIFKSFEPIIEESIFLKFLAHISQTMGLFIIVLVFDIPQQKQIAEKKNSATFLK